MHSLKLTARTCQVAPSQNDHLEKAPCVSCCLSFTLLYLQGTGKSTQFTVVIYIHSRKLTWNLKMMVSNRKLLFQVSIFGCHVSFWGCIYNYFCWSFAPKYTSLILPSWWFFTNPSAKYAQVKFFNSSPIFGVKIKQYLKPPPRVIRSYPP